MNLLVSGQWLNRTGGANVIIGYQYQRDRRTAGLAATDPPGDNLVMMATVANLAPFARSTDMPGLCRRDRQLHLP